MAIKKKKTATKKTPVVKKVKTAPKPRKRNIASEAAKADARVMEEAAQAEHAAQEQSRDKDQEVCTPPKNEQKAYEELLSYIKEHGHGPYEPPNTRSGISTLRATVAALLCRYDNPSANSSELLALSKEKLLSCTNEVLAQEIHTLLVHMQETVDFLGSVNKPNRLLHVTAGNEHWAPNDTELTQIKKQFEEAYKDPQCSIVVTRAGVQAYQIIEPRV
jgi:Zn-dependent M32 family carboxypeptidase